MIKDIFALSHQGSRDEMQDELCLCRDFGGNSDWIFGGVFDGHRGAEVARYAARNLPNLFLENLKQGMNESQSFRSSFEKVSSQEKFQMVGCCALSFFIKGDELYVANAGDCRLVMVFPDWTEQITCDHRISVASEKERIISSGGIIEMGYVWRGDKGLMPTRSLGDRYFRKVGVICKPEVFNKKMPVQPDVFLIAATDGVWDEIENNGLIELLKGVKTAEEGAKRIVSFLLDLRSMIELDNVSIILAKT